MNINQHFKNIQDRVKEDYKIAEKAREKGLDPSNEVEIPIATSLAEKSLGLVASLYPQVGDKKIVNRIVQLEKEKILFPLLWEGLNKEADRG